MVCNSSQDCHHRQILSGQRVSSPVMRCTTTLLLLIVSLVFNSPCHGHTHAQLPIPGDPTQSNEWLRKYGAQIDQPFSGPLAFSHLSYSRCLEDSSAQFDIAILGMPFDTGVSYRPGARFGPYGIRSGSRRQREARGWTLSWKTNPYAQGSKIIDCGDVSSMHCILSSIPAK